MFEKDLRPTCYGAMFPITPIEIGPGFVLGKERVTDPAWMRRLPARSTMIASAWGTRRLQAVTRVERTFQTPSGGAGSSGGVQVLYFGTGGFRTHVESFQARAMTLQSPSSFHRIASYHKVHTIFSACRARQWRCS